MSESAKLENNFYLNEKGHDLAKVTEFFMKQGSQNNQEMIG